ncbi:MAG: ring-cleaving dioxygenase [Halodesulfurarchaeum sp.]
MTLSTPGLHHVTAIAGDPVRNRSFYTDTLGLRLVKRSVNQDDPSVWHLFYGDRAGSPGSSLTVFPYPGASPGRAGTGQVTTVGLSIPTGSVEYWIDRLEKADCHREEPLERFDTTVVPFRDPDGLQLELVEAGGPPGDPPEGPVPPEHAIRGFADVTLTVAEEGSLPGLLGAMGYRETGTRGQLTRFETDGERGSVLYYRTDPEAPRGRQGAGTVHHVAFRVRKATQAKWREALIDRGLRPTEIIDRKWFASVYVRTGPGILFEFATETPGYTVDEPVDALGSKLVLPEWLENRRAEIESALPPLERAEGD